MRYIRLLGFLLALVTVLGVTTMSASAKLPEWGKCEATEAGTGGKYSNADCTEKAGKHGGTYQGAYEWRPAAGEFSTDEPGGVTLNGVFKFETAAGVKIECHGMYGGGFFERWGTIMSFVANGATTPLWSLTGCVANGDEPCQEFDDFPEFISNFPEHEEEYVPGWDHPARLGFIERDAEPEPIIGLGFKESYNARTEKEESFFRPIVCEPEGEAEIVLRVVLIGGDHAGGNGVIGTLGPVNAMSSSYTLTYSESAPGIQSPTRFAHKKPQTLRAFIHNQWEPVAFVGQMDLAFSEDWEIKATS